MVAIVSIGGYILHRKSLAVVDDNQPAEVRIAGDGQAGGIEINGPDGNVRFGSSAGTGLPAWMPAYPRATIRGNMVGQRGKEAQDNSTFKTKDSPVQVISFYENHFKGAGFEILSVAKTDVNGSLSGLSADRKRTVAIVAGTSDEGTEVGVSVIETK